MADYTVPNTVTFDIPSVGVNSDNYPYQAGIAGEEIEAGEAVYRDNDNLIMLASNGDTETANMIGIAANHARTGQLVSVGGPRSEMLDLISGGWPVAEDVHLSGTPGKLCPLADVASASGWVTRVGKFTEEGRLVMNLEVFNIQL